MAKGERTRYFLEYEVEEPERYFENAFFTNCKKFVMVIDLPKVSFIKKPVLFYVNPETGQKEPANFRGKLARKNGRAQVRWEIDNITIGKAVRIEW